MKDYYLILEVSRRATQAEIKTAYRDKIRFFHPDHWHDDAAMAQKALERAKDLNEAYSVLSDPRLRAAYDRGNLQPGAARRQRAAVRVSLSGYLRRFPKLPRALLVLTLVIAVLVAVVTITLLVTVLVDQSIAPTATPAPAEPASSTTNAVAGVWG